MTTYAATSSDQPLIHQFIRLFGHRPTPTELEQYQRAQARLRAHLPARIKRRTARLITRL